MVERTRLIIQHLSFVFFLYGGRLGIQLGNSLPCFSCPYVGGCAGNCYLMVLQRSQVGFQVSFDYLFSQSGLRVLWPFIVFLLFFYAPFKTVVRVALPLLFASGLDHHDKKKNGHTADDYLPENPK